MRLFAGYQHGLTLDVTVFGFAAAVVHDAE